MPKEFITSSDVISVAINCRFAGRYAVVWIEEESAYYIANLSFTFNGSFTDLNRPWGWYLRLCDDAHNVIYEEGWWYVTEDCLAWYESPPLNEDDPGSKSLFVLIHPSSEHCTRIKNTNHLMKFPGDWCSLPGYKIITS